MNWCLSKIVDNFCKFFIDRVNKLFTFALCNNKRNNKYNTNQMQKQTLKQFWKSIDTAKKDKEDAGALKAEYEDKLKNVGAEAEEILSDARKRATTNENHIIAEAKEEAARIIKQAHTEAELEKEKVKDEVKKEMVEIASLVAGKVVGDRMDTTVQDSLVEETLKEVGEKTWQS